MSIDRPGELAAFGSQLVERILQSRIAMRDEGEAPPNAPKWMHALDELYDRLRGPAEDVTVMATGFADPEFGGSGEHEPLLMGIAFGDGRVFHTTLGHTDYSINCVGFVTTLNRGTEWAATGKVTQAVPSDFPTATAPVVR